MAMGPRWEWFHAARSLRAAALEFAGLTRGQLEGKVSAMDVDRSEDQLQEAARRFALEKMEQE